MSEQPLPPGPRQHADNAELFAKERYLSPDNGPGLRRRPMAKASTISLFARRTIENVSPTGMQALLDVASRVSEGQANDAGRYFGSTIVSIDLQDLSGRINDACDISTAARLRRCMAEDAAVIARMRAIGRQEAEKLCGALHQPEIDVRIRAEGSRIFVDIDVEGLADGQRQRRENRGC